MMVASENEIMPTKWQWILYENEKSTKNQDKNKMEISQVIQV